MKNKIMISSLGVLIAVALIGIWVSGVNAIKQSENSPTLTLKVSSEKQIYIPGEVAKLNFELVNDGNEPVKLPFRPDISTGYLSVWIAFSGQRFNRYNNTSWGKMEYNGPTLQPGQSFKSQADILYNSKPDISRLNVDTIKDSPEGAILSDYAFPEAGVYLVKAVLSFSDIKLKVESEPIQIVVNKPIGEDLKVWNQIKDNGDIAYFMQKGATRTYQDAKAEKLLKEIEQITQQSPNSFLAGQMKQKLEKFRTDEETRKEMLEKAKVKPKN
ncbi:MAG: hypothetical protein ACR2HG_09875 [Pyrinomonadaceae bacterium]